MTVVCSKTKNFSICFSAVDKIKLRSEILVAHKHTEKLYSVNVLSIIKRIMFNFCIKYIFLYIAFLIESVKGDHKAKLYSRFSRKRIHLIFLCVYNTRNGITYALLKYIIKYHFIIFLCASKNLKPGAISTTRDYVI